jgi:hypothetical protein
MAKELVPTSAGGSSSITLLQESCLLHWIGFHESSRHALLASIFFCVLFYISLLLTVPFAWLLADFCSFEAEELKECQGRGAVAGVPFICGDAQREQRLWWGL